MADDLVSRARRGDLSGLNLAGLVRLSTLPAGQRIEDPEQATRPFSGRDIKSTDEQEKDTREYTERRSGLYVYTYQEPGTSAWKRRRVRLPDGSTAYRVVRPVFEGALDDLKRGVAPNGERLDGLVVYDIDRLTRDNRHLEDAIEVVQHYGRPILDYTDTLDLLTDNGRTIARILVATSNKQSADTAGRVARKHRALQQAGIPTGGRRPFGWQADKRTLDPKEAEAVRSAAGRLMAGAPLAAIVADWNKEGFTSSAGNPWLSSSVKTYFRNPRLCGYRARSTRYVNVEAKTESSVRMEVVVDANGDPLIGQWQPILTVSEWESVIAIIGAGTIAARGKNSRVYLLSGILRCGACGARFRALKPTGRIENETFKYACQPKSNGGCGKLAINGPQTDEHITELVIQMYEREAAERGQAADRGPWPKQAELDSIRSDILDLTRAWRATPKRISSSRYFALLPELEDTERSLAQERDTWLAAGMIVARRPASIRAEWDGYPLAQQRAYIEDVLQAVIVNPLPAGARKRFRADRLDPIPARRLD